ncbi:MAG: phosphoglycerate mutase family protein [Deferribacterota bacterium]|nr:phosphoglycerate mutase family protein [Deferribacterota bacterium]
MDIYLIRHAHALNRDEWSKDDLKRPLTKKGEKLAHKAFKKFVSKFKKPNIIFTSEAERSVKTGKILNKFCSAKLIVDKRLNPGSQINNYHSIITEYAKYEVISIVSHNPDIQNFVSDYLSEGKLMIVLKKGSIIHIKDGALVNLIQQKILR